MAFNSVKPTAGGDVPAYMSDLDERVKTEFDATKIESGSNANGSWVKFPSGEMICYTRKNAEFGATANNGAFISPGMTWEFPQPFTGPPAFTGTPVTVRGALIDSNPLGVARLASADYNGIEIGFWVFYSKASTGISCTVSLTATGRWK